MRKLLLALLFLIVCSNAFSQGVENYNYSIGLRAYSVLQLPKILNQVDARNYTNAYANGIMAKFNDNQISYRLRANYFRENKSFYNQCRSCEIAEGKVTDYSATVGFEKNINYGRLQPYFGADLGFRVNSFNGEIKTLNPKSTNLPYNVDTDKSGFLISPIFGLKYSPIDQFSLFAETTLDFYYSYERQETVQQDAANTRSFSKYNKSEYLLNLVSFGVLINLSRKD